MKNNKFNRLKGGFTLVELLVVIGIIAALAAFSTPAIFNAQKTAARTTSINNIKNIKTALDIFAMDFDGEFVSDTTASSFTTGTANTSEGCFTILIESGALSAADEAIFYTKELRNDVTSHVVGDGNGTLTANENAYSYVKNLTNTSPGAAPIVSTKLADTSGTFYTTTWDHRGIVARVNGQVKAFRLQGAPGNNAQIQESVGGTNANVFNWATDAGGIIVQ